jgi:VCBS repeat-containing protein
MEREATIFAAAAVDNADPFIDLNGESSGTSVAIDYSESDPVTPIAPNATLNDPDSQTFENGVLTVTFASGATDDDQLQIGGRFYAEEGALYYRDEVDFRVGSVSGGSGTSPLTITFNGNATPALVEELLRSIGYYNRSENPAEGTRTLSFVLTDGDGGTSNEALASITVTAEDDPAIAADDAVYTPENAVYVGSVFIDNGYGEDRDPDGPPIQVIAVNGQPVVGQTITLESGAKLRLNADGSFSYDPNGQFDLPAAGTGAVGTTATDSFTYTITGGDTANVTVTVTGVAADNETLAGTSGDDFIVGTEFRDIFRMEQGGNDNVSGMGGNDTFYFGATFTAGDRVDGGGGTDSLILDGDYSGGVTLGTGTINPNPNVINVETISLVPARSIAFDGSAAGSHSYRITTVDGNVPAGGLLKVNAFYLGAGENLTFDGSAERDGRFIILAGLGADTLTGGSGNDVFVFGHDGRFAAGDVVNGGPGYDVLYLRGDYTIDFRTPGFATALSGIESVFLAGFADTRYASGGDGEFDYNIIWTDATVAASLMTFNASTLGPNETFKFDGSFEATTNFRLFGGAGDDELTGGAAADIIYGGLGSDTLAGGGGNDLFLYYSAEESTPVVRDTIADFQLGDLIDLSVIDANVNEPGNQAFTFIGSDPFTKQPGQLRFDQLGPMATVQGDTDGDGNADFELQLVILDSHPLSAADFVL